jgi:HK97 gp10 family phage protein
MRLFALMIKVKKSNWFVRGGDGMKVDFTGLEALSKQLSKLENAEQIQQKALQKAGRHLVDELKVAAPYHDGTVKDNLKLKRVDDHEIIVHTGKAFHAHLIEFGRSAGKTQIRDKNGVMRTIKWGSTTPNPFMTRTYESQIDILQGIIAIELRKGMGL